MAIPRVLTALKRVVYITQDFSQYRVARSFRVHQHQVFNKKSIIEDIDDAAAQKQRPKTVPVPKITLQLLDNSITVTVLEDAQRLAKRRKLTLVKVDNLDRKTQRPLYKLATSTIFLQEENTEDNSKDIQKSKGTKLLYISSKISEHDLQTKTKNILKLLSKGYKAKIVITLDDITKDKTQSIIEEAVKSSGKIQKMPSKKNVVLLLVSPLLNNKDNSIENKEEVGASSATSHSDNV